MNNYIREGVDMTVRQYIAAAVGLAKGWELTHIYDGEDVITVIEDYPGQTQSEDIVISFTLQSPTHVGLDALAAALVRQVDNMPIDFFIEIASWGAAKVWNNGAEGEWVMGDDRSLNSIKAIVDSGVLK